MQIEFSPEALAEYDYLIKRNQKKHIETIVKFIKSINNDGVSEGLGCPERLKYYGGRYVFSRRITTKHRLVYEYFRDKEAVAVLSCMGHYKKRKNK